MIIDGKFFNAKSCQSRFFFKNFKKAKMAIAIGMVKPLMDNIPNFHTNMGTFVQNFMIFGDVCGDFIYEKLTECSISIL